MKWRGRTPQDKVIAGLLRRTGRPLPLVVNKCEGMNRDVVAAEFHELGCGEPRVISSAHGEGVRELLEFALTRPNLNDAFFALTGRALRDDAPD